MNVSMSARVLLCCVLGNEYDKGIGLDDLVKFGEILHRHCEGLSVEYPSFDVEEVGLVYFSLVDGKYYLNNRLEDVAGTVKAIIDGFMMEYSWLIDGISASMAEYETLDSVYGR